MTSVLNWANINMGVGGEEAGGVPLCDRGFNPNAHRDLGANHRGPWSTFHVGRGLQKDETPLRSPWLSAISTEVNALIWTGSLGSSRRRLSEFHRRSDHRPPPTTTSTLVVSCAVEISIVVSMLTS